MKLYIKVFFLFNIIFTIPSLAVDTLYCIADYEFQTPMGELEFMLIKTLGDINTDGYDDWAYVFYDENTFSPKDSVWIFFGNDPVDFTPDIKLFAHDIANVGDVNGDGYNDIAYLEVIIENKIISIDSPPLLYILHGGPKFDLIQDDTCEVYAYSENVNFSPIGTVGDINGDGYDDIFCGISHQESYFHKPKSYIFLGRDNLLRTPDLVIDPPILQTDTTVTYCDWGEEYASLGDINHDGYGDFACVFNYIRDTIYIYYGSNSIDSITSSRVAWLNGHFTKLLHDEKSTQNIYITYRNIDNSYYTVGIYHINDTIPVQTYQKVSKMNQQLGDINADGLNDWLFLYKDPYRYRGYYGSNPVDTDFDFVLPDIPYPSVYNPELIGISSVGNICGDGYDKLLVIKSSKILSDTVFDDDLIYHIYCYSYNEVETKTEPIIPEKHDLLNIYPNPFNPITKINYCISDQGIVDISIFNIQGKKITNLVNEYHESGKYSIVFNAQELGSGIYIALLRVNKIIIETKKILFLK